MAALKKFLKKNIKVLTALGLVITLVLSSTVAIALADSSTPSGSGTSADPYIITTAAQLADIPTYGLSANYKLGNDIDLASYTKWTPIGSSSAFTGTFDGDGHTISNLTIGTSSSPATTGNLGLFCYLSGATIQNLNITASIYARTSGSQYGVGSLAAYATNSTISNISAQVNMDLLSYYTAVGGLVGDTNSSPTKISYCRTSGTISGLSQIGGIVGNLTGASATSFAQLSNSSASATVNAVGGSGSGYCGGLAGYVKDFSVTNSYSSGTITGPSSGTGYCGGLAGQAADAGTIYNSYFAGGLTSSVNATGGVVGVTNTSSDKITIANSYVHANISGAALTGGLVGAENSTSTTKNTNILNCYYSGTISGQAGTLGGISGSTSQYGVITSSYFDKTSISNAVGTGSATITGTPAMTLVAMQTQSFADTLNSNITSLSLKNAVGWKYSPYVNGGYPYLDGVGNGVDTTPPTGTFSLSPSASTPGPVTITLTAADDMSGVASITLPDGSTVTTSTATYQVSANGDYSFTVKDNAGNSAILTETVSNISATSTTPDLSVAATYALSSDSTSATVTATVTDDSGTTISAMAYASGTQTAGYFASAGTAITPSAGSGSGVIGIGTFSVSSNGDYTVYVKDSSGNEAVQTVTVSGIVDSGSSNSSSSSSSSSSSGTGTASNLSVAATYALSSDSTSATVTATVTDDSGTTISAMAYASGAQTASYFASAGTAITPSAGSGSGVIGVGTFAVSSNGDYTVYVKDSNGNEAVQTVTVSDIGSDSSSSSSDPGSSSSSETDTVGVSGTISASGISVTHPTTINYTIDANGNFVSPDFPITNNSAGPVKVTIQSLKSIAGGSLQFTDVDPLSEDWSNLDLADSLKYIALGIGADTSTGWTSGESTNTFWSVNTTPLAIGDIASAGSASLKLTAYNGKVFDKSYTAEHSLVLEFDLD